MKLATAAPTGMDTSTQPLSARKNMLHTIYALVFCHPKYLSFATEGCDSVLIDDEV